MIPVRLCLSALGLAVLGGCAVAPLSAPYAYPYEPAGSTVWVESPAPVYPVVPLSPYAGSIWIEGTWIHDHGRRHWHPGRWAPPAHGHRDGWPGHRVRPPGHRDHPPAYRERPPHGGVAPGRGVHPGHDERRRPPGRGGDGRGIAPAWGPPGGSAPPPGARGPRGGGEHRMRIPRQPETAP